MKKVETIFESTTGYDSKNITNKSNIIVDNSILEKIEKGITSETLETIINQGIKVFKYRTQITIHGLFDELTNNRIYGYANIFQNKNKSIGIKYNAIDEEKRIRIKNSLKYAGFKYTRNSTECYFSIVKQIDQTNYTEILNNLLEIKSKIDTSLFTGHVNIYKASGFGIFYLILELTINIISESNIDKFINNIITKDQIDIFVAKQEAERKAAHVEYANSLKLQEIKRAEIIANRQSELDQLNKYELIEKTNLPGLYIKKTFNYKDELCFELIHIYTIPGKQKPRWNRNTFETIEDALNFTKTTHWNDSIYSGILKNVYKIS